MVALLASTTATLFLGGRKQNKSDGTGLFGGNVYQSIETNLGDPGAVSWVAKNGGESFQERVREPLGCYS